jgi:molecular chaperone GrpE
MSPLYYTVILSISALLANILLNKKELKKRLLYLSKKEEINIMKENTKKTGSQQETKVDDVQFEEHAAGKVNKEKESKKRKGKNKEADDYKSKYEELKEKYDELNDRYLRLYSEFDNFRKRTNKEKLELIKSASEDLIIDLLPVLDDFERALNAFEDHNADPELIAGVELIYNKFLNVLKQKGLKSMDSMGKEFDTDYHEALTNIPAPSEELKGKVVDVIQKGYLLNDKVIRYAKVVVGK